MKRTLQAFFILLGLIIELNLHAQNGATLPNIMSPEATAIGDNNVNYYTGTPNISIPLHKMQEGNIQIPIALSYDASGVIPNKNSSIVGLNWNLIAGGAITRIVNGKPDDLYNPNPDPNPDPFNQNKGYIYGQLQAGLPGHTAEYVRKIQFLANPENINNPNYTPKYNLNYEYEPDIFTFNFLGHSGKFFLDNTGNVRITSNRKYKVNLTNLKPQYDFQATLNSIINGSNTPDNLNNGLISQIIMTSDDGYEFTFGGSFREIEVAFNYTTPIDKNVDPKSGVINAWYLTKVKSPEGSEILFNYKLYTAFDQQIIKSLFLPTNNFDNNMDFLETKIYRNQHIMRKKASGLNQTETYENTGPYYNRMLIKHCLLNEIKTKLQTLSFNYQSYSDYNFYEKNIYDPHFGAVIPTTGYCTKPLTGIVIKDNLNSELQGNQTFPVSKSINFSYDYISNAENKGYRLFLKGFNINGKAKYDFSYYGSSLHEPHTMYIDLWGYDNNKTNGTLVPDPDQPYGTPGEYEADFTSPGCDRRTNPDVANKGLLKSITNPNGGTTEFIFESHDYSKVLKRKVSSGIVPVLENANGIAGGVRIKQIKNTPGTTTTYKYTLGYEQNPNGLSSGILSNNGVYILNFKNAGGATNQFISDNNIVAASSYGESHIGYKEVVAINSEGFTKYKFTNHETNPDSYSLGEDSYKITTERSNTNYNNQMKRLFKYSSREEERGKLMATEVYNSSNILQKSIQYNYNTDPLRDTARTMGVYCPDSVRTDGYFLGLIQSYALYNYHNKVSSITEKDYRTNIANPLTATSNFKYFSNTDPLLKEKSLTQSDGSSITYQYKYPQNILVSPYTNMVAKNIVSPVVEETILKNNAVVKVNKHNYGLFNNNSYRITNEKTVSQLLSPNVDLDVLTVTKYTAEGNIAEANQVNDVKVSYLWGYKGMYPIANVVNADLNSIAYSSFETDDKGNFTYTGISSVDTKAPTGKKVYVLSGGSITKNGLAAKTYIVSYWSKNGQQNVNGIAATSGLIKNGWTYFKHEIVNPVNGTITISGTGTIDELRLYPKEAQMTTSTYEPLVGVTSQNDASNNIVYYEYDEMGRLAFLKDQDKNILKKMCYNYAGEQESCSGVYYSKETSKAFLKNNCPQGYIGIPLILYSVPANKYTSEISQADADAKALAECNTNGQANANTNGKCIVCYAQLSYQNVSYYPGESYGDVVVNFYKDQACTIPIAVNNLTINYILSYKNGEIPYNTVANGTGIMLEQGAMLSYDEFVCDDFNEPCYIETFYYNYYLLPNPGYYEIAY